MKPIEECKTIAELLESPERLTKMAIARDEKGTALPSVFSKEATCFCLLGSIVKVYSKQEDRAAVIEKLKNALNVSVLSKWSDEATHSLVLETVKKLGV